MNSPGSKMIGKKLFTAQIKKKSTFCKQRAIICQTLQNSSMLEFQNELAMLKQPFYQSWAQSTEQQVKGKKKTDFKNPEKTEMLRKCQLFSLFLGKTGGEMI